MKSRMADLKTKALQELDRVRGHFQVEKPSSGLGGWNVSIKHVKMTMNAKCQRETKHQNDLAAKQPQH